MTAGALNTWSKVAKEGPAVATNTNCLGGPTGQQCPGLKRVAEQAKNTNTNTNIDTNTNVNTNAKELKQAYSIENMQMDLSSRYATVPSAIGLY